MPKDKKPIPELNLPSPLVRVSVGSDGRVNVRLDRRHIFDLGLMEKGKGYFSASYHKPTNQLILLSDPAGIKPQNARGKALEDTDQELSYYFADEYLGFDQRAYFGRISLQSFPYRLDGWPATAISIVVKPLGDHTRPSLEPKEPPAPPVLLKDATLQQVVARLNELTA